MSLCVSLSALDNIHIEISYVFAHTFTIQDET